MERQLAALDLLLSAAESVCEQQAAAALEHLRRALGPEPTIGRVYWLRLALSAALNAAGQWVAAGAWRRAREHFAQVAEQAADDKGSEVDPATAHKADELASDHLWQMQLDPDAVKWN